MTAVRANLGVRWRTYDPTRGRFSYSHERLRTTANARSAISKTDEGNLVGVRLPLSAPAQAVGRTDSSFRRHHPEIDLTSMTDVRRRKDGAASFNASPELAATAV